MAYSRFLETFRGDRWQRLVSEGARVQRPLWASTSTKNPDYSDTMYVDSLVVPHTVNTMPLQTVDAYQDHGPDRPEICGPEEMASGQTTLDRLAEVGVDYQDVVDTLEREGVEKFSASWAQLTATVDRAPEAGVEG